MDLRVDYHFHPKLSKNKNIALKKAEKIWSKFLEHQINCVIVTEHAFDNPKYAYEIMLQAKPKSMYCVPGMEYVTKEGIDIILFAKNPEDIYLDVLKPYNLTFDEVVHLLNTNKKIYGFVTHPYMIGTTGIIAVKGKDYYNNVVNKINAVEINNCSFVNFEPITLKLFKKRLAKVLNLPKEDYPREIKFFAGGSDAHRISEIGSYMLVNKKQTEFESIISNRDRRFVVFKNKFSVKEFIISMSIAFYEGLIRIKRRYFT